MSFKIFFGILVFVLCFISMSVEAYDLYITKSGTSYTEEGARESDKGGGILHINGGWVNYVFNVSEYYPWITSGASDIRVGVYHSNADRNEGVKGGVWATMQVKQKSQDTYDDLPDLTDDDSTPSWAYGYFSKGSYVESKDGSYIITIRIYAKDGITDHAEAYIHQVQLKLSLDYSYNAAQIQGSPKTIDFGSINLGNTSISQNATIENIGAGATTKSWKINTPTWINTKIGTVAPNSTATIPVEINPGNLSSSNISELSGKLVPVFDTGLDPNKAGLKGDFYHVPDADLNNLDTALALANRKLVYSDIFPSIQFNKGTITDAFTEDEAFKSGTVTTNVRRDFVAVFTGFIKITKSGSHRFYVSSDDGFRLKIDGSQVIAYTNGRGTATTEGTKTLSPGIYPIELTYFQGGSLKSLSLEWEQPGETRAIIPSSAFFNGLNILVKASPIKPTVQITNSKGSNNKVNVAVNRSAKFTATAANGSTGVNISGFLWQKVTGSADAGTAFESTTVGEKNYTFSDVGNYRIYCKSVDAKGVESNLTYIDVVAWNPPIVKDTPPQTAITNKTVSWYAGKYVGVINQDTYLMADGQLGSNNPTGESIDKFIWDFDNNWSSIEKTQRPITQRVSNKWTTPAGGQIKCKAVNNYGIESDEKLFGLKIYDALIVSADGPYNGRPNREVELIGTINTTSYAGASFVYQWYVKSGTTFTAITTGADGKAKYIWTADGEYEVKFGATVTTSEGLVLTGETTAFVKVESGLPTAMANGPYRCGIFGGNFTPVQVEGNPPDYIEADDVGLIKDWVWVFDHGLDTDSGGEFKTLLAENVDSVIANLNAGNGTAVKTAGNVDSGIESLKITTIAGRVDSQRYRTTMPSWNYSIVENPTGANQFRYITFAWRKDGGTGIMVQLYGSGNWNHRYYSGANVGNWVPAIQVSADMPAQWEIVTRDLFADWGAFNLNGIAFTAFNGNYALFDDFYLHKTPFPPIGVAKGNWKATQSYTKAGKYIASLKVKSEFGKWSLTETTEVQAIDGKITGYVRAADLRTPIKDVVLTLKSSHVDVNVLKGIAGASPTKLGVSNDGEGITTTTDANGFYSFEHIPLGSYRVIATKVDGSTVHEFQESGIKVTELTLDAPNQLAIDFVDLSVFPISGKIVYSIKKNGLDVFVEDVEVVSQAVGSTNSIKSLKSAKSGNATGGNYSLPLFSGQYLFLAERQGHDIRIKTDTPNYNQTTGLVTIDRARTDINFVDYTSRELTVFVVDSGGHKISNKNVEVSGDNGQAVGKSDSNDGKLVATLPPGKYTVTVPGAKPETDEVDLTSGDQSVTMTIPAKIALTLSPKPKFFYASDDFLELFELTPDQNPEGYMFYYPPEPRTHVYTIKATANGYPVDNLELVVNDEVSMTTDEPAEDQTIQSSGSEYEYTLTAGLPKMNRTYNPPIAAPKRFTVWAKKDGYLDSDIVIDSVTVLGDVSVGDAMKVISIPVVNYTVLHDPPGDGSYSYLEDALSLKGIVSGMTTTINQEKVPVYPSPWSDERKIADFTFAKEPGSTTQSQDLGSKGLLGSDRDAVSAGAAFVMAGLAEAASGALIFLAGPAAFAAQLVKVPIMATSFEAGSAVSGVTGIVQYEVSPNRRLETASDDEIIDILGPGKGDIYFGEGWTLGLQTKYRLGIKLDNAGKWVLNTSQIETYDILERTNQYIYTIRDIVNIIENLNGAINSATDTNEKDKLTLAKTTWEDLLNKNLAYVWNRDYVSQGKSFEEFAQANGLTGDSENLIFSAGPKFEYSRKIGEGISTKLGYTMTVGSAGGMEWGLTNKWGFEFWGTGITMEMDFNGEAKIETGAEYGSEWESGKGSEQTVGFVLNDNDVGDNLSTRVYADPVWGTPIFFQDAGSVTSDPWEPGTNKAVDLSLELLEQPSGKRDYRDGAHYKLKIQYAGQRKLETNWSDFVIYSLWTDNQDNMTVEFNGQPGPYQFSLDKNAPETTFLVSIYPSEKDWANNEEKEYSLVIEVDEVADSYQINRVITLKPKFADLRAPRATITAPYDGERVSPVFFPTTEPFYIKAVSNDSDLDKIQLQIRTKQPNGVWEPWRNLSGMSWKDGDANPNVEILDRLDRVPIIREFTFKWTDSEIRLLGVGEYAIRAIATDKATSPNMDVDPPFVVFLVDDAKPTVLTTIPNYQDKESLRIYRGELSSIFTDDMRADDFNDVTFEVTDLLKGGQKVAGFVSYSPTLRKAVFVPVVPFNPNGFYRAEIKTDTLTERGVHDLAGNPLDNVFMFTFRTTDAPFEPTWTITLSASDGTSNDANNIAGTEYGALDGDDERDAMAVPGLASKLRLSYVDTNKVEYDRDIRPADGRLSYHWFFVISNATNNSTVTIKWKPTIKLTQAERQYQAIRLVEFDANGNVVKTIPLDPTKAVFNTGTGQFNEMVAYSYKNNGEASRYFRLDVQKADLVATDLKKGSSGWRFLSVPIIPQRDDPFVNLGDDIDPFQLYRYDTKTDSYKIYPLDLGEVSLQTGRGYFTRLDSDTEVDVGGASNLVDVSILLETAGWYAVGNPFILPVNIANLKFNGQDFNAAVTAGLIEGTLYRWKIADGVPDAYEAVDVNGQLNLWDGYWLKTKQANITMKIPAPAGLATALAPLPESFNPPLAPPVASNIAGLQFSLRMELLASSSSDITTSFGTREDAQVFCDIHDQSEPPTLGQTVSAYFDHQDWGGESGLYNTDYQPILNIGEEHIWNLTVFTDKVNSDMTLSWEKTISQVPGDIMLYFRRADGKSEWQDMRKIQSISLKSNSLITKIPFEVKAQRFAMSEIESIQVVAGEKRAVLRWQPNNNEFIDSYIITRQENSDSEWQDNKGTQYVINQVSGNTISEFIDTNVSEDKTYTYQISVRFLSGAELKSELYTVKIMPVIKQTVLLPCYPNPFNPEVWIPYELSEQSEVEIQIYNIKGQLVRTLDLGMKDKGRYTNQDKAAYWDGLNETGERTSSGVYFYVLKTHGFSASKKMVMLK